jgi:hypothetical protein
VIAVAARRCADVFDPPGCVTLWRLPEAIEEELEARWEHWLDHAGDWEPFFEKVERLPPSDLASIVRGFELAGDRDLDACSKLRRSAEGRAVALPAPFTGDDAGVALLALGFSLGEPGELAVPYAGRSGE